MVSPPVLLAATLRGVEGESKQDGRRGTQSSSMTMTGCYRRCGPSPAAACTHILHGSWRREYAVGIGRKGCSAILAWCPFVPLTSRSVVSSAFALLALFRLSPYPSTRTTSRRRTRAVCLDKVVKAHPEGTVVAQFEVNLRASKRGDGPERPPCHRLSAHKLLSALRLPLRPLHATPKRAAVSPIGADLLSEARVGRPDGVPVAETPRAFLQCGEST